MAPVRRLSILSLKQGIYSATAVVLAATVLGKLLGLVRDILVARYYGASEQTDALYVALAIPGVIATSVGTSIGTGVVPLAAEIERNHGPGRLREFFLALVQATAALGVALAVALAILAVPLVQITAPRLNPSTAGLATTSLRILSVWCAGEILYFVVTGVFQSRKNFIAPALAGVAETAGVIAALALTASCSLPHALPLSWLGGMGLMAVGLGTAFALTFHYRPQPKLWSTEIKSLALLAVPLMAASACQSAYTLLDRFFAARLPEGSIAALNYGFLLITVPMYLLVVPGSTAALPFMAEMAAAGQPQGIHRMLEKFSRLAIVGLLPITAFTFVYAQDLVRLVYERGAFDYGDTLLTAAALKGFALAIFPWSCVTMLGRVFYAFKDAGSMILALLSGLAVKALLCVVLVERLSQFGVAFATSVGALVSLIVMTVRLRRKIGPPPRTALWKPLAGTVACTAACLGGLHLLETRGIQLWILWRGAAFVIVFLSLYLLLIPGEFSRFRSALANVVRGSQLRN